MKYNVKYEWECETYVAGQYATLKEANAVLADMRADKWHAWIVLVPTSEA